MADRQMLAVHGLAMLAVIDIRVMQVDELFIAIGDDHPMPVSYTHLTLPTTPYV